MERILLMLTGGTICSFADCDGIKDSDQKRALPILIDSFRRSGSQYSGTEFDVVSPVDILSENMTVSDWNKILAELNNTDFSEYKGIIITHGTDTLAYTAAMLSIMLAGSGAIPVMLVSSQFPLTDLRANGNDNFRHAVELISKGITPNVYAVYRNTDGATYIHKGAELLQCNNYSDDFFSKGMVPAEKWNCIQKNECSKAMPLKMGKLKENKVLCINPYPGIDYSVYNLEGRKIVLHGLYHSSTLAAECDDRRNSAVYLLDNCRKVGILFVAAPFSRNLLEGGEEIYSSTDSILGHGAFPLAGTTKEMAYAKAVIAASFFEGEDIKAFLKRDIIGEFIY